ncbi:type I-D CRISPR-associated protein Cas5/Csc1 [Candidatus Poribacteria bacterium]|nr:type I-D CRISPR-associated protein Cas5/Csc1 [Candidatus Poribacteria bacterium]
MNMEKAIHLNEYDVCLFMGRLYNHDYLWFSSNEISKISTTQPVIHNYALSYALSHRSYGIFVGSTPKYVDDPDGEFGSMPVYATPADCKETVSRTTITFNALDTRTLTTGDSKTMNTPNLGKRVYLDPIWEPREIQRPRKGYQFYAFVFDNYQLPSVVRIGKKSAPVRIWWEEITEPVAFLQEKPRRPTHLINPLDINGKLISFDPVIIPPHMLFRMATIAEDWWVFGKGHAVHVPKRVLNRIGSAA